LYGLPRRLGQLKDISKFDNEFFGVSEKEALFFNPQGRMLLETTYEAIVDAGYDPDELRGRNIGVFVGNSSNDTHEFLLRDAESINENVAPGCVNGLLANRISQVFDFKGTSAVGDSACSSGLVALHLAVQSILRGEVEAAVVGGSNLCLRPGTSIQFLRLGPISDEGVCRTFDADGDQFFFLFFFFNQAILSYLDTINAMW
ncbi:fatty acid synthase, partial [Trichonephila inaurata madagascariensis]